MYTSLLENDLKIKLLLKRFKWWIIKNLQTMWRYTEGYSWNRYYALAQ